VKCLVVASEQRLAVCDVIISGKSCIDWISTVRQLIDCLSPCSVIRFHFRVSFTMLSLFTCYTEVHGSKMYAAHMLKHLNRMAAEGLHNKEILMDPYFVNYLVRLCGLVVRVSGCISRGPGFDPRQYHIF
jgi:hypothetical protein